MSKYHVLSKVAKPYALSDGDVVAAQPGKVLVIPNECDRSESIMRGCALRWLAKIEEEVKITAAVESSPVEVEEVSKIEEPEKAEEDAPAELSPEYGTEKPVEDSKSTDEGTEETVDSPAEATEKKKKWRKRKS